MREGFVGEGELRTAVVDVSGASGMKVFGGLEGKEREGEGKGKGGDEVRGGKGKEKGEERGGWVPELSFNHNLGYALI